MAETDAGPTAVPLDAGGLLNADILCIGCGYNLRALALDASCPECSRSVQSTLERREAFHAQRLDLARLGAGFIAVWAIVKLAVGVLAMGVSLLLATHTLSGPWSTAWSVGVLLLGGCSFVGAWLLVAPVRLSTEKLAPRLSASVARIAWLAALLFAICGFGWLLPSGVWLMHVWRAWPVRLVQDVAEIIAWVTLLKCAEWLARRLGQERLARGTRVLLWAVAAILAMRIGVGWLKDAWMTAWLSSGNRSAQHADSSGQGLGMAYFLLDTLLGVFWVALLWWMLRFRRIAAWVIADTAPPRRA